MSVEGSNDWPVPGEAFRTGRWPRAVRRSTTSRSTRCLSRSSPTARAQERDGWPLRELYAERKQADNLLINARIDISKMVQYLEIIDFLEYGLRDADGQTTARSTTSSRSLPPGSTRASPSSPPRSAT